MWSIWTLYLDCLQQPLIIFGLILIACSFWFEFEIAIVIAIVAALFMKIIFETMIITNENFCSLHNDRWCPEKDTCFQNTTEEQSTMDFLNDNDKFIKELYDFAKPDDPAYATMS